MATMYTDVKFVNVDVDELEMKYSVTALPTYILYENGEVFKTVIGPNGDYLEEMVKSLSA